MVGADGTRTGTFTRRHTLNLGDVVQLDREGTCFHGCFMIITEIKSFGAQGFIAVPGDMEKPAGRAYLRLAWDQMYYVGRAVLVPADDFPGTTVNPFPDEPPS
jgi:hypothetical protein